MSRYLVPLRSIDNSKRMLVGGKAANLGELCRLEGVRVPDGFCVSTEAYKKTIAEDKTIGELLYHLSLLKREDRDKIRELSAEIRKVIAGLLIPGDLNQEIRSLLSRLGEDNAYAIRSSATAEDLPDASFAGQQDTYLNITGQNEILVHIRKCWASLFTERAVIYRLQNRYDHRKVFLSVIVQRMLFPESSGILFTADPVSSNRKVLSIDAGFGLGEGLVSGLVNADNYKVRNGNVTDRKIATKTLGIYGLPGGGTRKQEIAPEQRTRPALTDEQILQLERMGRTIEAHFGYPQDVEWCLADNIFYVLQSRPITTLFPIPETHDQENHLYVSVGHQQMMTDPIKPLGLSIWQLTAARPMITAGGRLFVDIANDLATPGRKEALMDVFGKHDPLIKDAVRIILERGDFIKQPQAEIKEEYAGKSMKGPNHGDFNTLNDYDPTIVGELIRNSQASLQELKNKIRTKSQAALVDFILDDIRELKKIISDPRSFGVIMTAMNAASWLNEKMQDWLGEKNPADIISLSAPGNITSEMGLALLDVSDLVRPYPQIIAFLKDAKDDSFMDELVRFEGGKEIRDALLAYFDKYGMRCAGEIDITKPRWSEHPATLVPTLLRNIHIMDPGAGRRKFEQGRQEALKKEQELLDRLRLLSEGEQKARETKRMIDLVRNLTGYREYPKYAIVSRYYVYKQALLREAQLLVQAHVLHETEDIYYLGLEELREVLRSHKADDEVITKRKNEYRHFEKLSPPRVITSDGEIIAGRYKKEDFPPGAILGLPVSSGIAEGKARVILKIEDADPEEGDILVTPFTDPSWTPLFVSIKGLVTEVGGLMTHGAVIAREYGIPAVIGVENATRLIKDGQRIRVHGTEGYVEIL